MRSAPSLILAIEAAVSGGSLSLVSDGKEIRSWIGTADIAQAESLLDEIDLILRNSGLKVQDLDLVAVSAGPGSFTGIRVGMATALGLKRGLGIDMASESALNAMAKTHKGYKNLKVAVPMGRDTVCSQVFDTTDGVFPLAEPLTASQNDFISSLSDKNDRTFLLHNDLFEKVGSAPHVLDFGRNIALAIAAACAQRPLPNTEPMFISKK